jgi:hypothetical protein
MASASLDIQLVYDVFKCDQTHQEIIAYLTTRAISDSSQFKDIYPWRQHCDKMQYVYIAARVLDGTVIPADIHEGSKLIWCIANKKELSVYGWMVVSMEEWNGIRHSRKIAYVNELTTKQAELMPPSEYVKGIGSHLIRLMEDHMKRLDIDFIKLLPLPNVIGFYKKMGYRHCLGFKKKGKFMCKIFNKKPSRAYSSHIHKLKVEHEEAEKQDLEEGIAEIKSQLTPEENELFDAEMKKDEGFAMNALFFYLAEEPDIQAVRDLLYNQDDKQGRSKAKIKRRRSATFKKSSVKRKGKKLQKSGKKSNTHSKARR